MIIKIIKCKVKDLFTSFKHLLQGHYTWLIEALGYEMKKMIYY